MNYKSKNTNLKRKRAEFETNISDCDENPDSGFTFNNGKITAYPANIKIIDSRSFNLDIQQEDSDLIHRLVHISTGLIPISIREQKDSITLNVLTEKDSGTSKVMSYIIQLKFPKLRFNLDELTEIKLYCPDRITDIEIDYDLETDQSVLDISLLSSTNHVYFKSRTLYVDHSSIQHYTIANRTVNYDTNFMKRPTGPSINHKIIKKQ